MAIDYLGDQSRTKAVHELPVYNLKEVQGQVLSWIKDNTGFLDDKTSEGFWMKIDYKDLARSCPALIDYFRHVKIPIQEITVGVLTEVMTDGFAMHHGSPGRNFKINFPILNTEDVYTEWYDIPGDDLKKFPEVVNPHTQQSCYNLSSIHKTVDKLYPLRVSYNMHECPIVFNSYLPHRVMPGNSARSPRIMLATMPVQDPFDLMKLF
jgi:hypothetical protein